MRDGKELKPCLSGRGVTKVFGFGDAKTVAVDHVDFDFHEGEFVSIVGESGSGKSVTVKTLMGLLGRTAVIEKGSAMYKGMDLTKLTEKQRKITVLV